MDMDKQGILRGSKATAVNYTAVLMLRGISFTVPQGCDSESTLYVLGTGQQNCIFSLNA